MGVNIIQDKSKRSALTHLILDVHYKGIRKKTSLKLSFKTNPITIEERNDKKEKLMLARQIANKKEAELLRGDYSIEEKYNTGYDFVKYANTFIKNHKVVETKKYYAALNKLTDFYGKNFIPCYDITQSSMRRFLKFLESTLNGETPANYFVKIKQIIKSAHSELHFRTNPCDGIVVRKKQYIKRDVLTHDDITRLWETHIENDDVKRAFLFCCYTGLRYCEVSVLMWGNVKRDRIEIVQSKTQVLLEIPLTDEMIQLLDARRNDDKMVFKLPSHTACSKWLRKWMKASEIDKKITWHCARHSFGTNLIKYGVDVSIASKLLGHRSLITTQRYVKVNEQLKKDAIAKLPSILKTS